MSPSVKPRTGPTLTYHAIKDQLRTRIGRDWKAGDRLPPLRELAQHMGNGQVNTLRAIKELVHEGLLVSRPGMGTYVTTRMQSGDSVSDQPRDDRWGFLCGKRIAVMIPPNADDILMRMADALASIMEPRGCQVTSTTLDQYKPLGGAEYDVPVVLNPLFRVPLRPVGDAPLIVVSTSATVTVAAAGRYDIVSVDQAQGGFLAGEAMRRAGCRSACFLGMEGRDAAARFDECSSARLTGFEHGWGEAVPEEHQFACKAYVEAPAAMAVADYIKLDPRPDAVFAACDEMALGFMYGALAHGLVPGKDYSLVGFDGQQRGRRIYHGSLSTVDVPVDEMGRRAAELLTERIGNPDQPIRRLALGCSFHEGTTIAKH